MQARGRSIGGGASEDKQSGIITVGPCSGSLCDTDGAGLKLGLWLVTLF